MIPYANPPVGGCRSGSAHQQFRTIMSYRPLDRTVTPAVLLAGIFYYRFLSSGLSSPCWCRLFDQFHFSRTLNHAVSLVVTPIVVHAAHIILLGYSSRSNSLSFCVALLIRLTSVGIPKT